MKTLYSRTSRKTCVNTILEGQEYCYFIVEGIRKGVHDSFICAFDGGYIRLVNGKYLPIAKLLENYIEDHGNFCLDPNTAPRNRKSERRVEEVLYSLYHSVELDDEYASRIALVNRQAIKFVHIPVDVSADEAELLSTCEVIDFSESNIKHRDEVSVWHSSGTVICDCNGAIMVTCGGKKFYTDYRAELYNILQRVRTWHLADGALKASIKNDIGTYDTVPFAEIVCAYHAGLIRDDEHFRGHVLDAHEKYRSQGLEADHLTENKFSNYISTVVMMPETVNSGFGARRTSIKTPYYFYTVHDHTSHELLVKCGYDSVEYQCECRFSFRCDTEQQGHTDFASYKDCFNAFIDIARADGCTTKDRLAENLLTYYADPENAPGDDSNPLKAMLQEERCTFIRYYDGAFEELENHAS